MDNYRRDCAFCAEFAMGRFSFNVPVIETQNFLVLADVAPVRLGHLLVLPRQHLPALSLLSPDQRQEMGLLVRRIFDVLTVGFGSVALGEHGSNGSVLKTGCMDHAHLHICPTVLDPTSVQDRIEWADVGERTGILEASGHETEEYVLWGSSVDSVKTLTPKNDGSQIVRTLLAHANKVAPTAWRTAVDRDTAIRTAALVQAALKSSERRVAQC